MGVGAVASELGCPERDAALLRQVRRRPVGLDHERRRMAGVDQFELLELGIDLDVHERRHGVRPELAVEAVDPVHDRAGRVTVDGIGAQRGAELRHRAGGVDAVPDHIAGGDRDASAADREHVVPVAAEALAARRQVAGGQLEAGDALQVRRQQAPLHGLGDPALLVEERPLDREGGAVGGELEQVALAGAEAAADEAADVQDAEDAAFDQQRDAEQRADALLAQDRVEDVGVVDVVDRDRAALCGDAAGEALADGDHDAALDLFLDPLCGACVQQRAAVRRAAGSRRCRCAGSR